MYNKNHYVKIMNVSWIKKPLYENTMEYMRTFHPAELHMHDRRPAKLAIGCGAPAPVVAAIADGVAVEDAAAPLPAAPPAVDVPGPPRAKAPPTGVQGMPLLDAKSAEQHKAHTGGVLQSVADISQGGAARYCTLHLADPHIHDL